MWALLKARDLVAAVTQWVSFFSINYRGLYYGSSGDLHALSVYVLDVLDMYPYPEQIYWLSLHLVREIREDGVERLGL